jgi:hypothetical protein
MQRAFIALLRGDFSGSLKLYPALIPIIVMLIFLVVQIKYNLNNGTNILVWMFISNTAIILISYFYKLFFFTF